MRRFFRDMNPTLRGFLIIAAIVVVVMLLNLYGALIAIGMLLRIAFFLTPLWAVNRRCWNGWALP